MIMSPRSWHSHVFLDHRSVVLLWEKREDSAVQSDVEKQNAELQAKLVKKACEDFILEEAEHLKVATIVGTFVSWLSLWHLMEWMKMIMFGKHKLLEERTMKRFSAKP